MSYDARTDYLYAAVGDPILVPGVRTNQGVAIYSGTSGELVDEVIIGDDLFLSGVLVTESAVFATTTNKGVIYKMPLEADGNLTRWFSYRMT